MPLTAFLGRLFGQKRVYLFCLGAVRRRLGAVRHGALAADAGRLPRAAGPRRRRAAADRAGHPAPDLPARGAGHGDGALRHGGHGRPGDRPDARRLHRRQLHLAVDLLHQPAGRRRSASSWSRASCTSRRHPRAQPRAGRSASARTSTGPASCSCAIGLAALQYVLEEGSRDDWFESRAHRRRCTFVAAVSRSPRSSSASSPRTLPAVNLRLFKDPTFLPRARSSAA